MFVVVGVWVRAVMQSRNAWQVMVGDKVNGGGGGGVSAVVMV